jgi:hypothetical protein
MLSVLEGERSLYSINVYGSRLVVKAEGREIKIFSVDGRLNWKG